MLIQNVFDKNANDANLPKLPNKSSWYQLKEASKLAW